MKAHNAFCVSQQLTELSHIVVSLVIAKDLHMQNTFEGDGDHQMKSLIKAR